MTVDLFDLLNSITLISISLVGVVLSIVIYSNKKYDLVYTYFSIALISLISIRLFFAGVILLFENKSISRVVLLIRPLFLMLLPLKYLYIKAILSKKKDFKIKDLLHFVFPIGLFLVLIFYGIDKSFVFTKSIFVIVVLYFGLYFYLSVRYIISVNKDSKRNYALGIYENRKINIQWVYTIISFVGFALVIVIYNLASELLNSKYLFGQIGFITSLLWLYCFFIIFKTPEFIFGINFKIEKNITKDLWLKNPKKINNPADIILNHKIQFEIKNYQKLLENLISNSTSYGNDFNINQLSAALSLPISYVSLIFKYYSIYTIVELKHLLRIREAKKLIQINKGQLSLKQVSELVGYKVYSSFYREYLKYDSKT